MILFQLNYLHSFYLIGIILFSPLLSLLLSSCFQHVLGTGWQQVRPFSLARNIGSVFFPWKVPMYKTMNSASRRHRTSLSVNPKKCGHYALHRRKSSPRNRTQVRVISSFPMSRATVPELLFPLMVQITTKCDILRDFPMYLVVQRQKTFF